MSDTTDYHERQLEAAPGKVARMLNAIAKDEAIRRGLESIGLDVTARNEGRQLLGAVLGEVPTPPAPMSKAALDVVAARAALTDLDQNDEGRIRRVSAALTRAYPELAKVVLADVKAGTGTQAITATSLLVARIRGLSSMGEAGVAARELLSKRGFTDAELEKMEAQVDLALGAPEAADRVEAHEPAEPAFDPAVVAAQRRAHQEALLAWWRDWSQSARAVITRRDHLISLGLLRRRPPQTKGDPDEVEEVD